VDKGFQFDLSVGRIQLTDEQLLEGLRRFAAQTKRRRIRVKDFDAWRGRPFCAATLVKRFGSWEDALGQLGLRASRMKQCRPEELIATLERVWKELGRPPGNSSFLSRSDGLSLYWYQRHWGTLRRACERLAAYHSGRITREQLMKGCPAPGSRRQAVNPKLRWQVLKRDRFRCVVCGRSSSADETVKLHIDHIHPVSRGGANTLDNLRTLCRECNEGKRDELPDSK
jgi:5-methylcytosine-specific restriction endonuclease McrA